MKKYIKNRIKKSMYNIEIECEKYSGYLWMLI
jgi:hypothetical protein